MVSPNRIAEVAAVVGDPARAAMLTVLMDGRALTAAELAGIAGITPQTASSHLARLLATGLLVVRQQGRHRYHRLASAGVARMLEGLMQHAAGDEAGRRVRTGPRDEALIQARTCYDHLAGRLGVGIADALVGHGYVEIDDEAGLITDAGAKFFSRVGILPPDSEISSRRTTRPLCRPCLDWSERRPHLAGRLGAALCTHAFKAGWLRRMKDSRAVVTTPKGLIAMKRTFGIATIP